MTDVDENLQTIMAITALDEVNAAILLTETGGDLEMATSIFFSGAWEPKLTRSALQDHRDEHEEQDEDDDSQSPGKKRRSLTYQEERHVEREMREARETRAPIASKVERLYGGGEGFVDPRLVHHASAANYGLDASGSKNGTEPVDIFREVDESSGRKGKGKGKETTLSKLFQLPKDLVFKGGLEMAKMRGQQENKWILLSIQTNSSFDSHRLNRDVWSQDFISSIVKGSFLFVQEDESMSHGKRLMSMYRLEGQQLPATLVLDPFTGSLLLLKSGFVDVERMSEALMPFLDIGPKDPSAGQLAISMASKLKKAAEASPKDPPPLTEEEAMEAAIRMSLAVKHDVSPASGDGDGNGDGEAARSSKAMEMDEEEEMSEEAIWAAIRQKEEEERLAATKKDPQTLKAEAEARLPAEPEPSNVGVVRVAMRLSDGSRVQRRFETKVKVQSLFDFLIASSLEAAEKGGSAFDLALAEPGAKPLVNPHDGGAGAEMTLEDAGLSGSVLLFVKWRG